MRNRRLTVIVPGYNNPDSWWCRCIDSILANIGLDDEVICVDDGSSDRPRVLSDYERLDPRVRVIYREANGGLSVARNVAMGVVRGEFVTFVDSDDEVLPGTYEKALTALLKNNADIALFGVRSIWINEKLYKEDVPDEREIGALGAGDVKDLFDASLLNYAWNKVYRSSFLRCHKMAFDPDGMPCEDIIFVLQCIMFGAKWVTVHHVGINYYRTHATLLSRYKRSYVAGTRSAANAWCRYRESEPNAQAILGKIGEVSERELVRGEWDNIWRLASPFRLIERWRFLKVHSSEIAKGNLILLFLRKAIYAFFRRYFYVAPVQRWHIKRVYPTVKNYK